MKKSQSISNFYTKIQVKHILFVLWVILIVISATWLIQNNIGYRQIITIVNLYGSFAPLVFIALFAIRPLIFFPASLLSLSAGALFGPTKAVLILIVAENLSAFISYTMGKYFGKSIIASLDKNNRFIHTFEKYIYKNGFSSVLTLRLLYAPFDLVGYFAGSSSISYKEFATATFVGILPGLFMSAFLGGSFRNPINILISIIFFILGIILSKFIKQKKAYATKYT